jgi:hypothetical protein
MISEELAQLIDMVTNLEKRFENLEKKLLGDSEPKKMKKQQKPTANQDIDFSLNERAFVKRYATNKSGPKKFTIVLAYLSGGKIDKNVNHAEIKKLWNKMSTKSLLGKFNMFYPNEAKTRGHVNSKEYGVYNLTKEWKEVL